MTRTILVLLTGLALAACSPPQQEADLPPPQPGDDRFLDAVQPDTQRVPPPQTPPSPTAQPPR
jgi:hypothetical protein